MVIIKLPTVCPRNKERSGQVPIPRLSPTRKTAYPDLLPGFRGYQRIRIGFLDKRAPSGVLKYVSFLGGGKHAVSCLGFHLYADWGISHHNSLGN